MEIITFYIQIGNLFYFDLHDKNNRIRQIKEIISMIEYSNFVYFKAFTNIYAVNVVAKNIRTFITTFLLLLLIILRINLQRMKIR